MKTTRQQPAPEEARATETAATEGENATPARRSRRSRKPSVKEKPASPQETPAAKKTDKVTGSAGTTRKRGPSASQPAAQPESVPVAAAPAPSRRRRRGKTAPASPLPLAPQPAPGSLDELMLRLGYTFQDLSLLQNALTHSSYANEKGNLPSNERLEFLGDAVLGMVAASYLYHHFTGPEGELTRLRAMLVCEKALHAYSQQLELGTYMRFGKGEQRTGGADRPSILADAFEAITAALYLDGGMDAVRPFLLRFLEAELAHQRQVPFRDYKTALQEIVQQNPEEQISYRLVSESGPDHNKLFVVEILLNTNVVGTGHGHSKKEAEQQAAREALKWMGYER